MKRQIRLLALVTVLAWFAFPQVPARAADPVSYAGGDGSSVEKAVVIKGGNEETGVRAEYTYLDKHFPGCTKGKQADLHKKDRIYDVLDFITVAGEKRRIYFDITGFYGKMD